MSTATLSTPSPDQAYSRPRRPKHLIRRTAWWIAVLLISITTVAPLLWTLATSFKPAGEILSHPLSFIPDAPTLKNYIHVFTTVPFARYFVNTIIVAVAGAAANLFFGSMAGYALSKLHFRGSHAVFSAYLASMMIPGIVTMIPTFLILRHIPLVGGNGVTGDGGVGSINTYWAVILPGAAGAFAVFFMKQFFDDLPDEMGEAARVDGSGEFRIFWSIYMPLSKSSLAVLGLLSFQAGWNNFMWPLIVLNDPDMMTIQVGLAAFVNDYTTDYGPLMAGTVITMVPVIIVFLFTQKWVVQGVAQTGGK